MILNDIDASSESRLEQGPSTHSELIDHIEAIAVLKLKRLEARPLPRPRFVPIGHDGYP
jgi:hypothetical protein